MPQNIFNLYSAVAFADQSLVTWPLDDDFSFISLIGASPVWTLTNGASASIANPPKEKPQETVGIADVGILTYDFAASASVMTLEAQSFSSAVTDTTKPTVCINSFIYTYNANISSIQIGFQSGSATYSYSTYSGLASNDWTRISHTASVSNSTTIKPYIKIFFSGANRTISLYNFSVGQWSESVNHGSLGSSPTSFSSLSSSATFAQSWGAAFSASPSIYKTYEIDSYGFVDDDNGYYIIENNRMLAENSNLPMVYGSGNVTNINPSQYSMPSMIFPGKGFLHENGRYGSLTAEFWMKIAPTASASQVKIFGPTSSDDGIYVNQNFITLNIGPYIKSYFVGKWYRPMLIHFTYSPTQATLMINGSTVITQNLKQIDIELPNSNIINTDWIAFYSHSSIKRFQIDSVSIYPYIITPNMAKRKLVYGQGVDNVNDIVKKFGGNPTYIDFAFANYSRNIIYPDNSAWNSGVYSNLEPQDKYLGFIQYALPELVSYGEDLSGFVVDRQLRSWNGVLANIWDYWKFFTWQKLSLSREMQLLYDNYQNQSQSNERIYFSLKPNSKYANVNSAIVFKDSNPLNDAVGSFLGVFSINKSEMDYGINTIASGSLGQSEMILMQFTNANDKIFKIVISDVNLTTRTFKIKYYIENNQINSGIEETITYSSSLYENTYFVVGLELSKINIYASTRLKNYFKDMNTIQLAIGGTNSNQFTGRIYRYHINNKFFTLNDSVTSSDSFSEYFDTNGFAKKSTSCVISSTDGVFDYLSNYTLLFKKANKSIVMDIGSAGYWQDSIPMYQLGSYISKPNGQTQFDLDMIQFNMNAPTGFVNSDNADSSAVFDSYVTIQKYQDVGTIPYSTYTEVESLNANKYIDFDNYSKIVLDKRKFRLLDGTIIFPPKNIVDFKNMYMTFHIRMQTEGININPIQLQNISIASLAFDNNNLYPIGTSNGNNVYPFTRSSVTYAPKVKNPFLIYKDSTPYLYLTKDSGVQVLPYSNDIDGTTRGISVPINTNKKSGFNIYGIQLWMLHNDAYIISSRKKLFSLYTSNELINFYIEPEYGNKRAKVASYKQILSQEQSYTNALIYQNGIKQDVYIEPLKWTMLTIEFATPINIGSTSAQLELYEGAIFNNIAIYDTSISDNVDNIFESYLGLSNIVVQDETTLSVDTELLEFYSDIKFTNFSGRML